MENFKISNENLLPDYHERSILATDFSDKIYVQANAGSGKTAELVKRYLKLILERKVDINRVVAITFTTAAAAEMKQRVYEEIVQITNNSSAESKQQVSKVLTDLKNARIQTIDSFAQLVLNEIQNYYAEKKLQFDVSETGYDLVFNAIWEDWARNELNDKSTNLSQVYHQLSLLKFGNIHARITELAKEISNITYQTEIKSEINNRNYSEGFNFKYVEKLVSGLDDIKKGCINKQDKLFLAATEYKEYWEAISSNLSEIDITLFLSTPKINKNCGLSANWPNEGKVKIQALLNEFSESIAEYVNRYVFKIAFDLKVALLEFQKFYLIYSDNINRHSFDGIVGDCINKLDSDDNLRQHILNGIDTVLIDEYQDTNALQKQLIVSLFGNFNHTNAKLFLVGDSKQSIYGFRDKIITSEKQQIEKSENIRLYELTTNFRSDRKIVDHINVVFSELFQHFKPSRIFSKIDAIDSTVEVLLPKLAEDRKNIEQRRADQEVEILKIVDEISAGKYEIRDAETGELRKSTIGDLTILTRTRNQSYDISRRLAYANFPCSAPINLESNTLTREVINCIQAIANPYHRVNLVAALKSFVFGCSDRDLLKSNFATIELKEVQKLNPNECSSPVDQKIANIFHYFRYSLEKTAVEVVDYFLEQEQVFETLTCTSHRAAEDAIEQLSVLRDNAQLHYQSSYYDFTSEITRMGLKDIETYPITKQKNRIECTTIHNAKGKEYNIVLVIFSNSFRRSKNRIYQGHLGESDELQLNLGKLNSKMNIDVCTEGFAKIEEIAKENDKQEEIRLGYVALTRAKCHLFVSLMEMGENGVEENRLFANIAKHFPHYKIDEQKPELPIINSLKKLESVHGSILRKVDSVTDKTIIKRYLTVTEYLSEKFSQNKNGKQNVDVWNYVDLTRKGTLIHNILAKLNYDGDIDWLSLFNKMILRPGMELNRQEVEDIRTVVDKYIKSPIYRKLCSAKNVLKEEKIFYNVSDSLSLEGRVDLVYVLGDEVHLIDFKTTNKESFDTESGHKQLELYAWMFKKITTKKVNSTTLVQLNLTSRKIDIHSKNLDDFSLALLDKEIS